VFLSAFAGVADNAVAARPHVTFSRAVTPQLLVGAETIQSVTVTLTIDEPLDVEDPGSPLNAMHVSIGNVPVVYGSFTPVTHDIVSHADVPGWFSFLRPEQVVWTIDPQTVHVGHTGALPGGRHRRDHEPL